MHDFYVNSLISVYPDIGTESMTLSTFAYGYPAITAATLLYKTIDLMLYPHPFEHPTRSTALASLHLRALVLPQERHHPGHTRSKEPENHGRRRPVPR